jgi:hypothetical protein
MDNLYLMNLWTIWIQLQQLLHQSWCKLASGSEPMTNVKHFGILKAMMNTTTNFNCVVLIRANLFAMYVRLWLTLLLFPSKCYGFLEISALCHSQGDSGGPIVRYSRAYRMYSQVGITSFGDDNCEKGYAVFTRVSAHRDWINANSCYQGDGGFCPTWTYAWANKPLHSTQFPYLSIIISIIVKPP